MALAKYLQLNSLKRKFFKACDLFESNKYVEAIDALQKLKKSYLTGYVQDLLGDCYYSLNEYNKAFESYTKAIEYDDETVSSYVGLGEISLQRFNYDDALKYFEKALDCNNELIAVRVSIALIHKLNGNYDLYEKTISNLAGDENVNRLIREIEGIEETTERAHVESFLSELVEQLIIEKRHVTLQPV